MYILSSARLRTPIKEQLVDTFPEMEFYFANLMDEGKNYIHQADILITYGEDLTDELIEKAEKLKWIMVISAGLEKMPFEAIKKKNILVTNARGIHAVPMAEYTIYMLLQTAKQAKTLIRNEQDKVWNRQVGMTEISGKTIGILGAGAIGTEIARLAKAFSMKTIGYNRSGEKGSYFDEIYSSPNELPELFASCDFIINVLPKTPETFRLIGKELFITMNKDAIFMNIGRGSTVVEEDLIQALENKTFAHAILDVFEQEPLPENNPLWEMDNVTVTPHISSITPQYQERAIALFEDNLKQYAKGSTKLTNIIPLERGY
ncbi:D-2-hydroxyacid dehydrogenase [Fictibacillus aquaticus]|uniref:D-2-hydroxyacid dehydrogenase n=1 Tax=Fictibacillus aquaticus TaxID=2021314 RepID=A0A235F543_9BACL|nr:D-2-hydroxyacid dehydrogenase [Fictibacillus aquaticus]OYD56426.1 D-2-hydroxyacid dehydrogenase [Fictibacillus aquaticus]